MFFPSLSLPFVAQPCSKSCLSSKSVLLSHFVPTIVNLSPTQPRLFQELSIYRYLSQSCPSTMVKIHRYPAISVPIIYTPCCYLSYSVPTMFFHRYIRHICPNHSQSVSMSAIFSPIIAMAIPSLPKPYMSQSWPICCYLSYLFQPCFSIIISGIFVPTTVNQSLCQPCLSQPQSISRYLSQPLSISCYLSHFPQS